jgi:UDP-N-acetylmuramoyl-L-alanyl-D-glutamate--2,6-diaminopimelate ligase
MNASSVRGPGMSLSALAHEVPGRVEVRGDGSVAVLGVQQDSRRILPGDLFALLKGDHANGAQFVADARARGAVGLLAGREARVDGLLPTLFVDDIRDALAFAAAAAYGHPSFSLEVVGITGTNGKTTTTHLVRAAVDGAIGEARCGIIGTVGHRFRELAFAASHTTPEADELARVLAAMRSTGATHAAAEVSSIALASKRVRAVRFRVAALTNLTQDHLEYHGTMRAYAAAKAELFTTLGPGAAVINVDDAFGREVATLTHARLVKVSAHADSNADIRPRSVTLNARGIEAIVRTPQGEVPLRSRLVGAHNVENLMVALGIVHALDLDVQRAAEALADEAGAPGRLERCDAEGDDVTLLVDYAHTPDALARALDTVRAITRGRVWCIFGCGGDRDSTKRRPMGEAVANGADLVIITNDNPRTEDPTAIAAPVLDAMQSAGLPIVAAAELGRRDRGFLVELDRARAIALAVERAAPGDVLVIAGKGHEDYQMVGADKRPFDDRVEARRALRKRRESAMPGPVGAS